MKNVIIVVIGLFLAIAANADLPKRPMSVTLFDDAFFGRTGKVVARQGLNEGLTCEYSEDLFNWNFLFGTGPYIEEQDWAIFIPGAWDHIFVRCEGTTDPLAAGFAQDFKVSPIVFQVEAKAVK